jgi:hypothetical protein
MTATNWVKPSGASVPVNENSAKHARSLGWLPEAEYKAAQKPKKDDKKD